MFCSCHNEFSKILQLSDTQNKICGSHCLHVAILINVNLLLIFILARLGLLAPSSSKTNSAAEGLRRCMDVFFDYGARLTFSLPTWKIWNTKDWKIFRKAQADEFRFAGYFVEK